MSEQFDLTTAFAPQDEQADPFSDGRERELLDFLTSHPDLESIRGSSNKVLNLIDEFERTKKSLRKVSNDRGRIVCDLIADVKPRTMLELGGYIGSSSILFGDAIRKAGEGGERYYTLNPNANIAAVAASLIDLAGLSGVVKVISGENDASMLKYLSFEHVKQVDIIFFGHNKPDIANLKLCEQLRLIAPGSLLVADNVSWPEKGPYLEYVRTSVEQKKLTLEVIKAAKNNYRPSTIMDQHHKISKVMNPRIRCGNPNLVYVTKLVEGSGPAEDPGVVQITQCREEFKE